MPSIVAMVDKLAKRNQIHKNKAGHLKSEVMRHLNALKNNTPLFMENTELVYLNGTSIFFYHNGYKPSY